jgi:hypothetical protein
LGVARLESRVIGYCREIGEALMGEATPAPRPRGRPRKEETPPAEGAARTRGGRKKAEDKPPENDTRPDDGRIEEEKDGSRE